MKNWLKRNNTIWIGGLICGLIGLIPLLSIIFYVPLLRTIGIFAWVFIPGALILLCDSCVGNISRILNWGIILITLIEILKWFLIGALIGLIIQKVRKK